MAWPLFARHWRLIGSALVLAALIAATLHYRHDARSWREVATTWRTAFHSQKAAYVSAQAAARDKAEAQRVREQSRFDTLAERADNADQEIADLRAAADRFARSNSLRTRTAAAQGAAGRAGGERQGDAAAGGDRSGSDADVVVPRADFDVLVNNTARLIKVNQWGDDLIAEGLAQKADHD